MKIDVEKIPKAETQELSKTFLKAVKRFYENEENLKAFEDWKKEQEAKRC